MAAMRMARHCLNICTRRSLVVGSPASNVWWNMHRHMLRHAVGFR